MKSLLLCCFLGYYSIVYGGVLIAVPGKGSMLYYCRAEFEIHKGGKLARNTRVPVLMPPGGKLVKGDAGGNYYFVGNFRSNDRFGCVYKRVSRGKTAYLSVVGNNPHGMVKPFSSTWESTASGAKCTGYASSCLFGVVILPNSTHTVSISGGNKNVSPYIPIMTSQLEGLVKNQGLNIGVMLIVGE